MFMMFIIQLMYIKIDNLHILENISFAKFII